MKRMLQLARRVHQNENALSMVEWILLIGAIALPLLIILIAFGGKIVDWLKGRTDTVINDSNSLESKKQDFGS